MDRVATWAKADRADLMRETGMIKKMPPEVVEKDFWVCWTLERLFGAPAIQKKRKFNNCN